MRIAMFYHSLVSDWNHGDAHFLRGVAVELQSRGHTVDVYEPADGWSLHNLLTDHGPEPVAEFHAAYPTLQSTSYQLDQLDLDRTLEGADLVIVHEWSDHDLVRRIGEHRGRRGGYLLLFHDTHHRSVTDEASMAAYDLSRYDGVLAFGNVIREIYLARGWTRQAWTWHEAADTRVFRPRPSVRADGDVVWIGNFGDDERTAELREFLIEPVIALGLEADVYGVRYPEDQQALLAEAGINYGGWLPNYRVPEVFGRHRTTLHIPRRPYVTALPGVPPIRVFEALACGIPLVCAPWHDSEGLFTPGEDYLVAETGEEMAAHLQTLGDNTTAALRLAEHGRRTILARHTCAHRVDQLMAICGEEGLAAAA